MAQNDDFSAGRSQHGGADEPQGRRLEIDDRDTATSVRIRVRRESRHVSLLLRSALRLRPSEGPSPADIA